MSDILLHGMINEEAAVYACDISGLVEEVRKIHDSSPIGTIIFGRALAAATMLCATLKNDTDRLTFMVNGGGPAGNVIIVGNAALEMKAYMGDPAVDVPPSDRPGFNVADAIGQDGFVTVIKDLGLKEPYVGKVPLRSGEIGEDVAEYLRQSEQTDSVVYVSTWLETDMSIVKAGGIIVTPLPDCSDETIAAISDAVPSIQNWTTFLMGETPEQALRHVFEGSHLAILDKQEPKAVCDCSRERLEGVLVSMGKKELQDLIDKDHGAELTCQFCNKKYHFSEQELVDLLARATRD